MQFFGKKKTIVIIFFTISFEVVFLNYLMKMGLRAQEMNYDVCERVVELTKSRLSRAANPSQ